MGYLLLSGAGPENEMEFRPTTHAKARQVIDEARGGDDVVILDHLDDTTRRAVVEVIESVTRALRSGAGSGGRQGSPTLAEERLAAGRRAWDDLVERYGILGAREVSVQLGSTSRNLHDLSTRMVREGRLLGVRRGNAYAFPTFQFDPGTGRPWAGLDTVLAVFREAGWEPVYVALWFAAEQDSLARRRPADVLGTDPDAVLAAARLQVDPW